MKPNQSFQAMLVILFSLYSLSGCTTTELASSMMKQHSSTGLYKVGNPYVVDGKTYYPSEVASYTEEGQASWYGPGFHGRQTANGEQFDTYDFTAAHRTLPMPSVVRVTNLDNGKDVLVRVNDRGPFKRDRIIDVSQNAAKALGFHLQGTTRVRVEFMPQESQMVAEAAKRGNTMTLAEVEAKMNAGQVAQQVPPPMAIASAQTTPIQTENLIPSAQAAELPPAHYQAASFTPNVAPSGHVLHEPAHSGAAATHSAKITHKSYVQIGAYENRAHAVAVGKKLSRIGAQKIDVINRGGVKLYRVRLAASNPTQAKQMLHRASAMGYGDAKIAAE